MKASFEDFRKACPGVDEPFLKEHLSRLGERYFRRFERVDLFRHVKGLSRLTPEHPVEALLDLRKDGSVDCTVLAFDYPTEFSIITGILAGTGYSILSGDVFTYRRPAQRPLKGGKSRGQQGHRPAIDILKRRRIVDHFSGRLDTALSFSAWAGEFRGKLREAITLLERGDDESIREAKHLVNEMVVRRLVQMHPDSPAILYPVRIHLENKNGSFTRMRVVSEDTPAFLYALTNALSLHGILIDHVRIRTILGRIEDEIDLVDTQGRAVKDRDTLNRIKFSVLLTKQFTYFLGKAPDPYTALSRFESLVDDLLRMPQEANWMEIIKNPHTLQDLAKLLGASDFLWEDFIRVQYESLLPMLSGHVKDGGRFGDPPEALPKKLNKALRGANSLEEQRRALNEFKDREIFLVDLDHILHPEMDFRLFSERLTYLAEIVVNTATKLVYDHLSERFGTPRSIGGLEASFAILGLGKLGGAALGYASDIELLFVYSDNGQTDGQTSISNGEFFDRLVKEVRRSIQAKREGIFHVDLRLRPYGRSGPLACSLESFCRYYGSGGNAHSYERLALVRMRAMGGDASFGGRLERLRDEMVYFTKGIDLQEIRELREKQFKRKTEGGKLNAKFSPGGLVDLEYGVQFLQVSHGSQWKQLRTPRIHSALQVLADAGVISADEALRLVGAYFFSRRLINGMRMLRGSARDLFLPQTDSHEFAHLARRMGYTTQVGLDPAKQLKVDLETHSASIRAFVERYFGRDSLPGPATGGVADLIISDGVPVDLREKILCEAGFKNPQRAYVNLRNLAGRDHQRDTFAKLAVLACDILRMKPDPDMALNNWERYIHSLSSPEFHYKVLLFQPMRLEILLSLFSASQFLADTLVRNPEFIDWVMIPEILHRMRKREDLEEELRSASRACRSHREWLNKLRRFRRREILRIGTRDICLGVATRDIMIELSLLAEALLEGALETVWTRLQKEEENYGGNDQFQNHFCILALGKLGGRELNYSSDIDLLGLCDPFEGASQSNGAGASYSQDFFGRVMEYVRADLSDYTEEGYAYRVDLRLRPYGRAGELVPTVDGLLAYFRQSASLWEIQAALKMRPIAGNLILGHRFMDQLRPLLLEQRNREVILNSIKKMRDVAPANRERSHALESGMDVKNGFGGLRDIEFLVQGLQMIHAPENPVLLQGNTLEALETLREANVLPEALTKTLADDYCFLRRVEHFLQVMEDRQIHTLPKGEGEITALAKSILGSGADMTGFMEDMKGRLERVHEAYRSYLFG